MMKKPCTLCNEDADELYTIIDKYVLDTIKSEHPEWIDSSGACKKCVEYYNALENAVIIE
ncbi:MAG: hypothetical protein K0U68_11165 [Gammaproteobacteria bacterium]|nr:hypothetical protein [Gammaproteobacteria bacterium]